MVASILWVVQCAAGISEAGETSKSAGDVVTQSAPLARSGKLAGAYNPIIREAIVVFPTPLHRACLSKPKMAQTDSGSPVQASCPQPSPTPL